MRIFLASISPRRKELLKRLGIKFRVLVPRLNEISFSPHLFPPPLVGGGQEGGAKKYALALAKMKVESVKCRVQKGIIIGMDTIVVLGKEILGKPKNRREAKRMVQMLSGKTHDVITGIYLLLLPEGKSISSYETTRVKFRQLTKTEIDRYIKTKEPYDKAGAYGIQGQAGLFVESINGCYFNVVGFPVAKFLKLLRNLIGDNTEELLTTENTENTEILGSK